MKTILILSAVLMLCGCASIRIVPENEKQVSKVYDYPNLSKTEIYEKSRQWLAETYTSAQDVIQYQDKDSGKVIGRGSKTMYHNLSNPFLIGIFTCTYAIIIEAKDNKARITFNTYTLCADSIRQPLNNQNMIDEMNTSLTEAAENFNTYIKSKKVDKW